MKCAPVIIPTLNRYKHLKRCLESLESNSLCCYTDVFISLDYPPSPKYEDGYKFVKDYLNILCGNNKFHNLYVFVQDENLGPAKNMNFLFEKVSNVADKWIFSEDDVEYSPNFLEYMNICLNYFEDESSIMAICGCNDFQISPKNQNVYKDYIFCPYGVGFWKTKNEYVMNHCREILFDSKNSSLHSVYQLFRTNETLFRIYINAILCGNKLPEWVDEQLVLTDCVRGLFNYFTNSYCIHPTIAKSHTFGNDGSGVNMGDTGEDPNVRVPLDNAITFKINYKYVNKLSDISAEIHHNHIRVYSINNAEKFKSWMKYIFFLINNKDRDKTIKMIRNMKVSNNGK